MQWDKDLEFWQPISGFVWHDDWFLHQGAIWYTSTPDIIIETFLHDRESTPCFRCEHLCRTSSESVHVIIFKQFSEWGDALYASAWKAWVLCNYNVPNFPDTLEWFQKLPQESKFDGLILQDVWGKPLNCPKI